jgi:pyruvate dehydrogenase E2 component (dihydrolipoamide acetyltransferase)
MANEIKLPELGEGIESAQVLSVLVSAGDTVKKDQTVIEVETEKATAEVPSDFAGTVKSVSVKEGDTIQVGQVLVVLEGDGAAAAAAPAKEEAPAAKAEPAAEPKPEPKPEPEPAPAPRAEAPAARPEPEPKPAAPPAASKVLPMEPPAAAGPSAPASPSVRRLARELGVPIERIPGTGAGGRISEEDVKSFARALISRAAAPAPAAAPAGDAPAGRPAAPKLPDFTQWGEVERLPMSGTRRAVADAMVTAWTNIPQVTQFDEADITELERFRKSYAKRAEREGVKLTVTAIAVKVAAAALKAYPQFNASVDPEEEEIIFKSYVNVGVAVDTDRGLLVPVIRDADRKSVLEIARDLGEISAKARDRKIQLDELRGGTFSVSNLGGLGTTYFSPIVNWPEVAILGMGRSSTKGRMRDGNFEPRVVLPLAVTYDHRVIDGADAARFLRWIAEALENPLLLALEG